MKQDDTDEMTPWLEVDKEIEKSVSEHTRGNLSD